MTIVPGPNEPLPIEKRLFSPEEIEEHKMGIMDLFIRLVAEKDFNAQGKLFHEALALKEEWVHEEYRRRGVMRNYYRA